MQHCSTAAQAGHRLAALHSDICCHVRCAVRPGSHHSPATSARDFSLTLRLVRRTPAFRVSSATSPNCAGVVYHPVEGRNLVLRSIILRISRDMQPTAPKKDSQNAKMETLTTEIGKRLKEERLRLGIKATDFDEHGGWPASTVYGWESGKASPKSEFYATTASLGFDIPYIITGQRSVAAEPTALDSSQPSNWAPLTTHSRSAGRQPLGRADPPSHSTALTGPAPTPDDSDDAIYVPLLSSTGSMGPGNELMTEDVVLGKVPLSRRWLALHLPRHRPQALRLVHAYGDSMLGTLNSGDFALVDTDVYAVDVDGVYVLQAHQRLFIKRVRQRLDGAYEVSSDNPAIKQSDVLNGGHEVRICGRVVYGWNGRRF